MAKIDFSPQKLEWEISNGYVTKRKHPEFDLWILNYTDKCTFERRWNDTTTQCRGLILDSNYNIIARPFKKFFNLNEHINAERSIPDEDFEVYDKLDGSLGISYSCPDGEVRISTRGSFESEQAIRGTAIFRSQFCCKVLDPSITYLFEIIYPENRYVVDYGEEERLVLIGALDTESGRELDLSEFDGWDKASVVGPSEGYALHQLQAFVNSFDNNEGVVVKFKSGLRLKIKSDEYSRLFKILAGLNEKSVWEYLRTGGTINDMKAGLPVHMQEFIDRVATELHQHYTDIYESCLRLREDWAKDDHWPHERKKFAEWIKGEPFAAVHWAMYDENWKKANEITWKLIKPGVSNVKDLIA